MVGLHSPHYTFDIFIYIYGYPENEIPLSYYRRYLLFVRRCKTKNYMTNFQNKNYFFRSFTFLVYHHIDMITILIFASLNNMQQMSLYTLFGAEFFNYCIFNGLIKVISRKHTKVIPFLILRDFIVIFIGMLISFN